LGSCAIRKPVQRRRCLPQVRDQQRNLAPALSRGTAAGAPALGPQSRHSAPGCRWRSRKDPISVAASTSGRMHTPTAGGSALWRSSIHWHVHARHCPFGVKTTTPPPAIFAQCSAPGMPSGLKSTRLSTHRWMKEGAQVKWYAALSDQMLARLNSGLLKSGSIRAQHIRQKPSS
jgi:hypothetical protein